MQICGINKTTLLDYPGHLATTIFLGGCNFRCPFCHNSSLVNTPLNQPVLKVNEVLDFLAQRRHILEGVCITGGEPTIHIELPVLIGKIKNLGLNVKLDSNGSNPSMIKYLTEQNLIDSIAIDIKNSKENYEKAIGIPMALLDTVCESVSYVMSCGVPYEFRTTVVKGIHQSEDFIRIGEWIRNANAYYLQSYKDSGDILSPGYSSFSKLEMENFKDMIQSAIPTVLVRGID